MTNMRSSKVSCKKSSTRQGQNDNKHQTFIPDGMNAAERAVKRTFDILISGSCMVAFSPLFLLCYILIKCDDGGPAIYRQERIVLPASRGFLRLAISEPSRYGRL